MLRLLFLLASLYAGASADLGVDYATAVSTTDVKCMVGQGYTYFIPRCWHSYGAFDSGVVDNVNNAWDGGASNVHAYMFPCATKSATAQALELAGNLTESNVRIGYVFLDIETNTSPGCGWPTDQPTNCQYVQTLISTLHRSNVNVGVYASSYMWSTIMGGSACTIGSSEIPLWYAGYNGQASFSDFSAFGGWTQPLIHQFDDQPAVCSVGVDHNYAARATTDTTTASSSYQWRKWKWLERWPHHHPHGRHHHHPHGSYGQSGYYNSDGGSYAQSGYYGDSYRQSGYYNSDGGSYGQSGYYNSEGGSYGQSGYYNSNGGSYAQSGYYNSGGSGYGQSGYYNSGGSSYAQSGYYPQDSYNGGSGDNYGSHGSYPYGESGSYDRSYGSDGYYPRYGSDNNHYGSSGGSDYYGYGTYYKAIDAGKQKVPA